MFITPSALIKMLPIWFNEGVEAYWSGSANPYHPMTPAYAEWWRGFAHEESK